MNLQIQIIKVASEAKLNKTGKTNIWLEVTYKNLADGKVGSKKLVDWANKAVFDVLKDATDGNIYTVVSEKEGEFWQWKSATLGTANASNDASPNTSTSRAAPVRSTYETPEERAKKQVYIVKQSAIAQAVALLSVGAKVPPSTDLVLKQAQEFVDFVFEDNREQTIDLASMPNDDVFPD